MVYIHFPRAGKFLLREVALRVKMVIKGREQVRAPVSAGAVWGGSSSWVSLVVGVSSEVALYGGHGQGGWRCGRTVKAYHQSSLFFDFFQADELRFYFQA
jgi:hypothetical protein